MFRYCVSAPVVLPDNRLIGVVTIYSDTPFTEQAKVNLIEATTIAEFVISTELSRSSVQIA